MAKAGCLLGVGLIGLSVVLMVGAIVLPFVAEPDKSGDQPTQWLEKLLCKSGETYTQEEYTIRDSRGTSTNVDMYCQDESGATRSVTGRMVLIAGLGFTVPFLLGLGLTMWAGFRAARTKTQQLLGGVQFATGPDGRATRVPASQFGGGKTQWDVGGVQVRVDPQSGRVRVDGATPQAGGFAVSGETLSDRLQELEDAYGKSLITRDEYERMRRRILDEDV